MFARVLAGAALACGLLAANGAALAQSAEARTLKGKTTQGYQIKVKTKARKLKLLRFEADLRCRDGSTLTLVESGFLWTPTKGNGSFRDAQFGKTDSVYIRGTMKGRRLNGKVRLTDKLRNGVRCKSRWIKFRAPR